MGNFRGSLVVGNDHSFVFEHTRGTYICAGSRSDFSDLGTGCCAKLGGFHILEGSNDLVDGNLDNSNHLEASLSKTTAEFGAFRNNAKFDISSLYTNFSSDLGLQGVLSSSVKLSTVHVDGELYLKFLKSEGGRGGGHWGWGGSEPIMVVEDPLLIFVVVIACPDVELAAITSQIIVNAAT